MGSRNAFKLTSYLNCILVHQQHGQMLELYSKSGISELRHAGSSFLFSWFSDFLQYFYKSFFGHFKAQTAMTILIRCFFNGFGVQSIWVEILSKEILIFFSHPEFFILAWLRIESGGREPILFLEILFRF
jgi:hypothetical protein